MKSSFKKKSPLSILRVRVGRDGEDSRHFSKKSAVGQKQTKSYSTVWEKFLLKHYQKFAQIYALY